VRERGMNGMRIFTSGGAMPKDPSWVIDPIMFPAFEEAEELGIPICFRNPPESFKLLPQLINEFPTVPIIAEYIYGPAAGEKAPFPSCDAFWALSDEPSFYLKLKTHNILELSPDPEVRHAFLARLVEVFGADRIAYGSNYPTSEGTLVEIIEDAKRELAFLPEQDREAIFSNTALTLYPALGTHAPLSPRA
jgi:predicted TIM-barrel fold metal-dependent hydrolase